LRDRLIAGEHRGGIELFDHRRLHAALPDHPLVVTGEFARASEPQGMMAVELLLARLDPPLDRTVLARRRIDLRGDRHALARAQGAAEERGTVELQTIAV